MHEFLARRLDHTWFPYLFVDATYLDVRAGHRVVSRALVVATGVSAQGRRKDPGHGPGRRRDHRFLDLLVLRSLRERGLKVPSPHDPEGVVLVTSDAHAGIRAAVRAILPGAAWQRCRVHFARTITSRLGSARSKPVNALVSTIFAQTTPEAVMAQYQHVIDTLRDAFPEIAQMLKDAEPDLTAFAALPREHWTKIRPQQPHRAAWAARPGAAQTSPRVFPDSDSARPLIGSVLPEQRGVAVRRTPIPVPDLPATPDQHAPHRQHRRRRRPRRPAPHHHLTERTPHQKT